MQTMTNTGLIRICSYCKRMMDDQSKSYGSRLLAWFWEMTEGEHISHGLCQSCAIIERKKLAQYRRERNGSRTL